MLLDFVKYYVYDYYLESTKNDVISFYRSRFSQESLRIYEELVDLILISMSPLLPYNAENIYSYITYKNKPETVFQCAWPRMDPSVLAQIIDLIPQLNLLMQLRLFISQ